MHNNNLPQFAVLMATYNGAQWIEQQIESIFNQKLVKVDLYISDDCSKDETINVIEKYRNTNKCNIHYIDNNIDLSKRSSANNFFNLIKNVDSNKYDYISFCDQDDIWDNDKLYKSYRSIKNLNADCYSSNVTAFWDDNKKIYLKKSIDQNQYDYLFESAGPGCTYVITSLKYIELKNWIVINQSKLNDIWFHDWLIYAFCRINEYKWVIESESTMQYRQHKTNVFGANTGFGLSRKNLNSLFIRYKLVRSGEYRNKIINLIDVLDYSNWVSIRIKRFNLVDRFILAFNVTKFRKKKIDQMILFIFFFIMKKFNK